MTTVAEILGPNRLCVSPSTLISEVARKMRDYGLELIAVCESGKFRGVVTEKEIISRIVVSAQDPKRKHVESLMINDIPKVSPGAEVMEAAKIMASHRITYLPVVQNGRFFGILTLNNLAKGSLAAAAVVLSHWAETGASANAKEMIAKVQ